MRAPYFTFLLLAILNHNPTLLQAQWVKATQSFDATNCFISFNNNLFIGTDYGILRSTDEGKCWYPVNTGLNNLEVRTLIYNTTTLFAGTAGGIFCSTDNGISWSGANTGLNTFDVRALTVLELPGGTHLFAGVYNDGLYISTNNGANWNWIYPGIVSRSITSIAVSNTNIFTGTDDYGIFCSTDNGTTWFPANSGLTNLDIRTITLSGTNIFAATAGGVFRSSNNGTTWIPVNSGLTNLDIRTLIAKGTDLFALTTSGEIFRSTDNGTAWIAVLTDYNASAISVSDTDLLAVTNFGVFRSTDNGTSWTEVNFNFVTPNSIYFPVDFAVLNNNLFAGCGGGVIVRSTDNGTNWIKVNTGLPNEGVGIVSLAVLDTIIFVGMYSYGAGYGVFRSTDKGLSWIPVNSGLSNLRVYALYVSEEDLFAGTDGDGVFLSTDYGDSWTQVSEGLWYPQIITSFASIGTNLFAGSMWPYGGGGVYRSTNKGINWTAVSYGLTSYAVSDLAVSGTNLFAGTQGAYFSDSSGIFCSTDNGANWEMVGLENLNLFALACTDNYIFAGTFNDGIFLSTNNGISWVPFNEGIDDNTSIISIVIKDPNVFISTYYSDYCVVWRRPLSDIITSVSQTIDMLPINYFLSQNYPNPFNSSTKITYALPNSGAIEIKVFNTLGEEIETLVNEEKSVGTYELNWNAANLPSGVYFYQLKAGDFVQTRKMILLK